MANYLQVVVTESSASSAFLFSALYSRLFQHFVYSQLSLMLLKATFLHRKYVYENINTCF